MANGTVEVVAVADLHGNLPNDLPEGEVLLLGGDVCPISDHDVDFQAGWLGSEFYPWLERLPHPEVVWIAGNHDFVCQSAGWEPAGRAIYLLDRTAEVAGLRIYGTPWIPELEHWAFYASDERLGELMEQMPGVDVVLSHGPPRRVGDRTIRGLEVGSTALAKRLEEIRPQLCVFGHIHEGFGRWERGPTTLANVSYVDERYEVREGAAMHFELETGRR